MHFAFEDDLSFQAGEIGIIANEVIELIGVVAVRHLIVRHLRRQILGFMNRDVDIRVGMRIAIDKHMAFHRQRSSIGAAAASLHACRRELPAALLRYNY